MKSQCKDLDVAIQVNDHIVSQRKQEMVEAMTLTNQDIAKAASQRKIDYSEQ